MIAWFRGIFRRQPSPPEPNVEAFVERTRASRAHAIEERAASARVTRELKHQNNFVEAELLARAQKGPRNA